jgi:branched-chain amino acid transport system substrate-binding protein
MLIRVAASLVVASILTMSEPALAADKVKVGFVSTLSGPSSALGIDIRDGFLLARWTTRRGRYCR